MKYKLALIATISIVTVGTVRADSERKLWEFTLTKGNGVEVCDAYLKRLNRKEHDTYPFCDRPEDGAVEGFEVLNRVSVSVDEAVHFVPLTFSFSTHQVQDQWDIGNKGRMSVGLPSRPFVTREQISGELNKEIFMWRYDPEVDIDNDGKPDSILVARGLGAGGGVYVCGKQNSHTGMPERMQQLIFVVDLNAKRVDEAKTKKLLSHPSGGYRNPAVKENVSFFSGFRSLGLSMGVFRYKNSYYLDTFFDSWGDLKDRRKKDKHIADTLGVFRRENGETRQICEYRWHNPDMK